ncbi:hypothetical protein EB815_04015 [Mesorhizobium loti]|nr:hypothetical protein EB815_04015 [Mesorhizobium loti]
MNGSWSMMPKSAERFSDDIMLYLFDLETASDFRSNRPEIIRLRRCDRLPSHGGRKRLSGNRRRPDACVIAAPER